MATNISSSVSSIRLATLKDLKVLGRKPAKGDIVVPGSMAHRYVFNGLPGALREEADRYLGGEITRMTKNAQLWEKLPTEGTRKEAKSVGVTGFVESAFVPEAGSREKPTNPGLDFSLDDQIGKFLAGAKIDSGFIADPDDGEHKVVITEAEAKKGKTGPYMHFSFKDIARGNVWSWNMSLTNQETGEVSFDPVLRFVAAISKNNLGIFEGADAGTSWFKLKTGKVQFFVWTVKVEEKILTYTDHEKFAKRSFAVSKQASNKELAEVKAKERSDRDARLAEDAKLTEEAHNEDAPF